MLGDIRDDVEFLGFTLTDILWVIGSSLIIGGFPFLLPVSVVFKLGWFLFVVFISLLARRFKWSFKLKRAYYDIKQAKSGSGEQMEELLGVKADGWFYRSNLQIHVVVGLTAPPWDTAVLSKKKSRLGDFENFIRACVREGFELSISSEQINDFRHDIWNAKRNKEVATPGIEKLKQNRIEQWEQFTYDNSSGFQARRSEYTLRLSIYEGKVVARERDDEPEGLDKVELKRFRLVSELREKVNRTLGVLDPSGHRWFLLSGFSTPEAIGRWWDRVSWEKWKASEGTWDESDESIQEEAQNEQLDQINEVPDSPLAEETHITEAYEKTDGEQDPEQDPEQYLEILQQAFTAISSNHIQSADVEDKEEIIEDSLILSSIKTEKKTSKDLLASIIRFRTFITSMVAMVSEYIKTSYKRRRIAVEGSFERGGEVDVQSNDVEEKQCSTLKGVHLITSPTTSGKSFLSTNVAVANSSLEAPIALIDLAPDLACYTLLNPVAKKSERIQWETWCSPNAPGLILFTPKQYPLVQEVLDLIENCRQSYSAVLVDLPWMYPGRNELKLYYPMTAVVDSDYHHWTIWEKEISEHGTDGITDIWLNQTDSHMQFRMNDLIKRSFGQSASKIFPCYHEAVKWIFEGRPFAINSQYRESFLLCQKSKEGEDIHDQL